MRRHSTVVALGLAALSTPFAFLAIRAAATQRGSNSIDAPRDGDVLQLAIAAVLLAGLVGGVGAGRLAPARPAMATAVAIGLGWFTGVVAIPLVAALRGIPYQGAWICIDGCEAMLRSTDPLSGVAAWWAGVLASLYGPVIVTIGATIGALMIRSHRALATVASAVAVIASTFWAMWLAAPAAIALVLGVAVWIAPFLVGDDEIEVGKTNVTSGT